MRFIWFALLAWAAGPRPLAMRATASMPAAAAPAIADMPPSQQEGSREAPHRP